MPRSIAPLFKEKLAIHTHLVPLNALRSVHNQLHAVKHFLRSLEV